MNITEEQVEKALEYLRDSAEEHAYWKGRKEAAEYAIKIKEAMEFLSVETGTQDFKKSSARASQAYKEAVDEYEEAVVKFTEIDSLRRAAEMKISWVQSKIKSNAQGLHL